MSVLATSEFESIEVDEDLFVLSITEVFILAGSSENANIVRPITAECFNAQCTSLD